MAGTRVFPNALELRDVAACATMERVERDLARAPTKLQPLLAYIRDQLFATGLNVQALKRECGIRDNSVSTVFGRTIGLPPRPYIEARRLETAERLLADTALPVNQIGELVGFSSEAVFYRAFRRWRGIAPSAFRTEAQADREPLAVECLRAEDVGRALRGRATSGETQALIAGLTAANGNAALAAAGEEAPAEGQAPVSDAEALWNEIRVLAPSAQRDRVRGLLTLRSDLAELLFERSRTEGRDNRKHGVHIAELAVECLYPGGRALAPIDPTDLATFRARAWAWLANAHRLALDFIEAEKALDVAKRTLPDSAPGEVGAEVLEIEGSLRHFQRRLDEARDAFENAQVRLPRDAALRRKARLCFQRAAMSYQLGMLDEAVEENAQGLTILAASRHDEYLQLVGYQQLIAVYSRQEKWQTAAVLIPGTRFLAESLGAIPSLLHQDWIEGLVWNGLGEHDRALGALQLAIEGFERLGERFYVALLCIDIANINCELGNTDEALELCAGALPLLDSLGAHRDVLVATQIVRSAIEQQQIQSESLRALRAQLEAIRDHPCLGLRT